MRKSVLIFIFLLQFFESFSQDKQKVSDLYQSALKLYNNGEEFKAMAELETVLKIDPYHRDALYSLAMINYKLRSDNETIELLKRCARLNDKEAINFLKKHYDGKLSYADTMQGIGTDLRLRFEALKNRDFLTIKDLNTTITSQTSSQKEQLQMLLLWAYENMRVDSTRFFNNGNPLPINQAFAERKGLCEEFSGILDEFCKISNIRSIRITGYVKYPDFMSGNSFQECNHIWNLVYLDSKWVFCDLFWSMAALTSEFGGSQRFLKRLDTDYFLALPGAYISDHLAADPVFQFDNNPISIKAFTNYVKGIDEAVSRLPYLNYQDSIKLLFNLPLEDRAVRMAHHSYQYNKENPNELIVVSFNHAVDIVNSKNSSKAQLIKARTWFYTAASLIDLSVNSDVRALKENCTTGITLVNKRLAILR